MKGIEQTIGEAIEYILKADNQAEAFTEVSGQMIKKGESTYAYFFSQYICALQDVENECLKEFCL